MVRYYVKGKQFWSIRENGKLSFTVAEGVIGGEAKSKDFAFKDWAKYAPALDKQIATARAAGFKPPKPKETVDAALEAAIAANPLDDASYSVYADWLQSHGQPRGELAAVQAALAKLRPGKAYKDARYPPFLRRETWREPTKAAGATKLHAEQARLLAEHALDPASYELAHLTWNEGGRRGHRLDWQHGFVRAAHFELGGVGIERLDAVVDLVGHPSCRFLTSLTIGELHDDGIGTKALAKIAKVVPATLRHLHLGDFSIGEPEISWTHIGDLSPLYAACPELTSLVIQGATIELGKAVALPKLRHLEIRTGGLSSKAAKAVAASKLPALETLVIWFGQPEYGSTATFKDIKPVLDGRGFPKVTHLALANSEFANQLAAALADAKILKQLRTLDLSMGSLDDDGASSLVAAKKQLSHLELLDLDDNYMTAAGIAKVGKLARKVNVGRQREPYDWDEDKRRYASIGE